MLAHTTAAACAGHRIGNHAAFERAADGASHSPKISWLKSITAEIAQFRLPLEPFVKLRKTIECCDKEISRDSSRWSK